MILDGRGKINPEVVSFVPQSLHFNLFFNHMFVTFSSFECWIFDIDIFLYLVAKQGTTT